MEWVEMSRMSVSLLVPGFLVLLVHLETAGGNPDAKRLYDDLLSNYNRLIRPVANNTDKITVKMGLKLSQLVDLVNIINIYYISNLIKNIKNEIKSIKQM